MVLKKSSRYFLFLFLLLSSISYSAQPPNIVIFCINCCNPHRVQYTENNEITPNIARFSKKSHRFTGLISPATYTAPCIYELFTAQHCSEKYPLWEQELKNIAFKELKEQGYHFYFPYSLFGTSLFADENYKEPFIIFEHLSDLHDPYDPEFNYPHSQKNAAAGFSVVMKELQRYMISDMFGLYRILFGFPETIYPNNIDMTGMNVDIKQKEPSLQHALITKYIKSNDISSEKFRDRILRALNFYTSYNSDLETFLYFKNNTLYIGDHTITENQHEHQLCKQAYYIFKYHFLDNNFVSLNKQGRIEFIRKDEMTNFYIYNMKKFYFIVLSLLFPSLEQEFYHRQHCLSLPLDIDDIWDTYFPFSKYLTQYRTALITQFYDHNLNIVDKKIGEKLQLLADKGMDKNSVIVILGDHGEALLEHEYAGHGDDVCYNEVINPPLLIHLPDQKKGYVHNTVIRTADIKPTLLDIIGVSYNSASFFGNSFFKSFYNTSYIHKITAFSRGRNYVYCAVDHNGFKIIYDEKQQQIEIYDLKNDPYEQHDLIYDNIEHRVELENTLMDHIYE